MSGSALRAIQRQARRVLGQNSKIIAGQPTPETHPEVKINFFFNIISRTVAATLPPTLSLSPIILFIT